MIPEPLIQQGAQALEPGWQFIGRNATGNQDPWLETEAVARAVLEAVFSDRDTVLHALGGRDVTRNLNEYAWPDEVVVYEFRENTE